MVATIDNIAELFRPAVTALGLELWGVEHLVRGHSALLRIYIDGPDGISIDDCEKVSRQVSAILDVEDPIPGEYTLEVSSPGFDRPLFNFEQFGRFVGEVVNVRLRTPIDGRRKFKGVLEKAENGVIFMAVDGNVYDIPYQQVDKANIAP
ncbi:MAG: ribosome maturation factor RimP [Pseudohongiella sp.]|nr:ribosome maturation factor RimP [Pseudohongiella sp.]